MNTKKHKKPTLMNCPLCGEAATKEAIEKWNKRVPVEDSDAIHLLRRLRYAWSIYPGCAKLSLLDIKEIDEILTKYDLNKLLMPFK